MAMLVGIVPIAAHAQQPRGRFIEPVDVTPLDNGGKGATWSAQGVGVLDPDGPNGGGLGLDLWSGAKANLVTQGLIALPPDSGSYILRQALETALLSTATPPAFDASSAQDFVALRAETLNRLGLSNAAIRLLDAAGGLDQERRAAAMAVAKLRHNNIKDSCDWATTYSDPARSKVKKLAGFWTRLNILCAVSAGDADKARFLTSLAEEQGMADGAFEQLINAATVPANTTQPDTALNLGRPVSDDIEAWLSTRTHVIAPLPRDPVSRSLVLRNGVPALDSDESRLALRAALSLARSGLINQDDLHNIMTRTRADTPDDQALEAIRQADYDQALAILAAVMIRDNHESPDYPALWQIAARYIRPWQGVIPDMLGSWLDGINPTNSLQTDLDEIASTAAMVRVAQGRVEDGKRWLSVATPDMARRTQLRMLPFEWLDGHFSPVSADAWMQELQSDDAGHNLAALTLHLVSALGTVNSNDIQPLIEQISDDSEATQLDQQDALLMVALDNVSAQNQKGMTLLLAAQLVGRQSPAKLDNGQIVAITRALAQTGMKKIATDFAREALIARMLPSIAPPPAAPAPPPKQQATTPKSTNATKPADSKAATKPKKSQKTK